MLVAAVIGLGLMRFIRCSCNYERYFPLVFDIIWGDQSRIVGCNLQSTASAAALSSPFSSKHKQLGGLLATPVLLFSSTGLELAPTAVRGESLVMCMFFLSLHIRTHPAACSLIFFLYSLLLVSSLLYVAFPCTPIDRSNSSRTRARNQQQHLYQHRAPQNPHRQSRRGEIVNLAPRQPIRSQMAPTMAMIYLTSRHSEHDPVRKDAGADPRRGVHQDCCLQGQQGHERSEFRI